MDRIEPRQDANWQDMEFRRKVALRGAESDTSLFAIGVAVFLLVAAFFPWYSYWVVSHLLERDAKKALFQFEQETNKASAQLTSQLASFQKESAVANAATRAKRDLARVKVLGVSEGGGRPVVLVNLGSAALPDVDTEVCRQATGWLNRGLSGSVIRVQQIRGRSPAVDAGEVVCP